MTFDTIQNEYLGWEYRCQTQTAERVGLNVYDLYAYVDADLKASVMADNFHLTKAAAAHVAAEVLHLHTGS